MAKRLGQGPNCFNFWCEHNTTSIMGYGECGLDDDVDCPYYDREIKRTKAQLDKMGVNHE